MLDKDLELVIEIRNKLAHGQWIYPFNSDGDAVESEKKRLLDRENIMTLQFKDDLIGYLADIVNNLVVSPATFVKTFDEKYGRMEQVRANLLNRSYEKYAGNLIRHYEEGKARRRLKSI